MTTALEALGNALTKAFDQAPHEDEQFDYLNTGYPPLNKIMSGAFDGGMPNGKMIEIFGDPSTGKTALASMFMAEAQRQGGVCMFQDAERSFNFEFAKRLGVNVDPPYLVHREPRTWEQANMEGAKFAKQVRESKAIPADAPIVFVLDSVAASIPKSTIDKQMDELSMNDTTALARVSSTTLRSIKQFMDDYKYTSIYLNQTRTKPGIAYGDPVTTPGGVSFEFYADVRLHLRRKLVKDTDKNFLGQIINCYAKKTKLTRPFQDCDIRLMFSADGMGYFDTVYSLVEWLIACGRIAKSGNYAVWIDGKNYYPKALAEKITTEGLLKELNALLPPEA